MTLARHSRTGAKPLVRPKPMWRAPVILLAQEAKATDKLSSNFDNTFHGTVTFGPNYTS